jgi:polyhydroxyalkanoate synthesis regulator phasin
MFDQEKATESVFNLAQDYTATAMQAMQTSMEMYEKSLDTMMKQGIAVQEEGRKFLADWTNQVKQGQKNYWGMMNEGLKKTGFVFSPNGNNPEKKRASAN